MSRNSTIDLRIPVGFGYQYKCEVESDVFEVCDPHQSTDPQISVNNNQCIDDSSDVKPCRISLSVDTTDCLQLFKSYNADESTIVP